MLRMMEGNEYAVQYIFPQLMIRRDKSICGFSLCYDAKAGLARLEVAGMISSFTLS